MRNSVRHWEYSWWGKSCGCFHLSLPYFQPFSQSSFYFLDKTVGISYTITVLYNTVIEEGMSAE